MISYIRGELTEINIDHIVVEVQGIGFAVYIPTLLLEQLPPIGSEIRMHTYFQVREDAMVLFGFLDKDDLAMFKLLLSVSGIGPKGALGILSALSADDLRFAILSGDSKAISKAPGIGAKSAQRVILELKDKMDLEDAFEKKLGHQETVAIAAASGDGRIRQDAILALTALGYSQTESLKAVSAVDLREGMDVEDILKAALKHL